MTKKPPEETQRHRFCISTRVPIIGAPSQSPQVPASPGTTEDSASASSRTSLFAMKPAFQDGARMFPDLRVFFFEGTSTEHHDCRLEIDKQIGLELAGRRPSLTHSWNIDDAMPDPKRVYVSLCGDREGAPRFVELATAAGSSLGDWVPWLSDSDRSLRSSLPNSLWIMAIFTIAWEHRPGLALRAWKVNGNELMRGCRYSALTINPFLASVILIDVLLEDGTRHPPNGGPWAEPLNLTQLGQVFTVHRNQVREQVLGKYEHQTVGEGSKQRYRLLPKDLPPNYRELAGLDKKGKK